MQTVLSGNGSIPKKESEYLRKSRRVFILYNLKFK